MRQRRIAAPCRNTRCGDTRYERRRKARPPWPHVRPPRHPPGGPCGGLPFPRAIAISGPGGNAMTENTAPARPEALEFLLTRRSRPAKMLRAPAPDGATLTRLLTAATRVPDHGKLEP